MNGRMINVQDLIARYSIEEHIRKADEYFEHVSQENLGATKPFSSAEIAIDMLPKLQTLLYSAKLFKGARILDFGAGAGWLARVVATMGMQATALDVSTTVLKTAKEVTDRRLDPKAAARIAYLPHDGLKIDAPDGSFDRVLSFDAFHHVPDQERIIKEIHRVLTTDGIASFVEPGPEHSKTQASQEEMRNHSVIENDIEIERIWQYARAAGFAECNLWFYSLTPTSRSIDIFNAIEAPENRTTLLNETWNSNFLPIRHTTRVFSLHKGGPGDAQTSRQREGLVAEVTVLDASEDNRTFTCKLAVRNTGSTTWLPSGAQLGNVNFGPRVQFGDGRPDLYLPRVEISKIPLAPGGEVTISVRAPLALIGNGELMGSLVAEHVIWFEQNPGNQRYLLRRSARAD